MKKFVLNLKDEKGYIRTGYEEILEGTREEVITDYLNYHRVHTDESITEADIACTVVDWCTDDVEIKKFTTEDFIQKRNIADLNEYGDFRVDYLVIDLDDETGFRAVGDLITRPRHMEDSVTLENVTLEVTINIRLLPADHPARQGLEKLTAGEIFNLPWRRWVCFDIPEDWEY